MRTSGSTSDHRPSSPLRLGVIGAEGRGTIAQHAHDPANSVSLIAACTLQPERIAGLREKFGGDFLITPDYREIVADFIRLLRGESTEGATPLDARMAVAAGYLGTESLRAGSRPFDLTPPS